jgi:hypothetical protein
MSDGSFCQIQAEAGPCVYGSIFRVFLKTFDPWSDLAAFDIQNQYDKWCSPKRKENEGVMQ